MKKITLQLLMLTALLVGTTNNVFGQATTTEVWNGAAATFNTAGNWTTTAGGAGIIPNSAVFCILNATTNNHTITISSFGSHCNGLRFDLTSATSGFTFVASSSAAASELRPRPGGTNGKGLGLENHDTNTMTFSCPVKYYSFPAGTLLSSDVCTNWAEAGDLKFNTSAFIAGLANPALNANGGTLYLLTGSSSRTITVGAAATPGLISGGGPLTLDGAGTIILTGNTANDYSGTTTLKGGTIKVGKANAFSTGTLDINGATGTVTLQANSTGAIALGNALVKFTASAFNLGAGTSGPLTFSGDVNVGSSTSTITDTGTNTFSGAVTNTGGFAKSGSGLLILSGNSSTAPNGPITVNAGTLRVDGTYTNSVTVASTATLGGNGTVGTSGTITLNGTISPGASPGTLTTGNETWAGGAIYRCELTNATGVAGTGWDLVNVSGTLTITATAGSPFTIKLATLKGNAAAGSMGNFSTDVTGGW
ncbi:MAG: autotransporter-associated beta strand repeat-containing protein, partial [Limisphaerales bacterium]